MEAQEFNSILGKLEQAGYSEEIQWQRDLPPCTSAYEFLQEAVWVILNSGMKNQIARKIWNKIRQAWVEDVDISEVFGHKGKVAAIKHIANNAIPLFDGYKAANDKIAYLKTLPFIGGITCYHLAKNLGEDVVKPDRHLIRIADRYQTTPDALCQKISDATGEKKCTVDIVLWRACNLKIL